MSMYINEEKVVVWFGGTPTLPEWYATTFDWDTTINQDVLLTLDRTISIDNDLIEECLTKNMYLLVSTPYVYFVQTTTPANSFTATLDNNSITGQYDITIHRGTNTSTVTITEGVPYEDTYITYDGVDAITTVANQNISKLDISYPVEDLDKINSLTNTGTTAIDFYHNSSTGTELITFGGIGTTNTTNQIISNLGIYSFNIYIPETDALTTAANGAFIGDCYCTADIESKYSEITFDSPNNSNSFNIAYVPIAGTTMSVQWVSDSEVNTVYCKGQIYFTNDYFTYNGDRTFTTKADMNVTSMRVDYDTHE